MRTSGGFAQAWWGAVAAAGLLIACLSPRFFLVVASVVGIGWLCWTGADPVHARPSRTGRSAGDADLRARSAEGRHR